MRSCSWWIIVPLLSACVGAPPPAYAPAPTLTFPPPPAAVQASYNSNVAGDAPSTLYDVAPTDIANRSDYPSAPNAQVIPTYGLGNVYGTQSGRIYTGNCPTPESIDAAGRRCGGRSAASRPGGYDGYGSWASSPGRSYGGTTYVRGHMRNGKWVNGYTRRSRR